MIVIKLLDYLSPRMGSYDILAEKFDTNDDLLLRALFVTLYDPLSHRNYPHKRKYDSYFLGLKRTTVIVYQDAVVPVTNIDTEQ